MMKTNERQTIREAPQHQPVLPEELHELPEGVVVPDDLSGLRLDEPTTSTRRTRAVRWLPWVAGAAIIAGGAVILSAVLSDDGAEPVTDYTTAQVTIQQAIDEALAARTPTVVELPNGTRFVTGDEALATYTTAQVAIQQAIDEALAAQDSELFTTAQVAIQEAIDEALAEFDR